MKKVDAVVLNAFELGYPNALQIEVLYKNKKVFSKNYGKNNYRYFDIASLTKILVTVPLIMKLTDDQLLDIQKPISFYLGFLKNYSVGNIKIHDLLAHRSGLTWWRPYFKVLEKLPYSIKHEKLKEILRMEQVGSAKKCIYSDLDFLLLGFLIQEIYGAELENLAQEFIFKKLNLKNTFYLPRVARGLLQSNSINKKDFAPTEINSTRGLIQGQVNDANAWSMGGVAPHAGLFSNLSDLSHYGHLLLENVLGKNTEIAKHKTLKQFVTRAVDRDQGDWGLGFMIPSKPISSAGKLISRESFGHTGFTGTSLWVDVKRKVVVSILSNRTYPTPNDTRFLTLRREIHDAIWETLDAKRN
jgi:CubicO group peptidase (beta-lactamase class C family)